MFICPIGSIGWREGFVPEHMVSLQNPGVDTAELRPEWISPDNHYSAFFFDIEIAGMPSSPTLQKVRSLIDWLTPRCGADSRFLIHCDMGRGRSAAAGYIAWAIHLGPGREQEAFDLMVRSCVEKQILPNLLVVSLADEALGRNGQMIAPLQAWNERVPWSRTHR